MTLRVLPVNFFDADHCADLAVTPAAVTTLPITNLQSNVRGDVWRSTSLATQVITGSFGGNARQISAWGIWPGDASSLIGSQARLRMWSDVAKTTLVYDQTYAFFTPAGDAYNSFLWGIQYWNVENGDRTARLAPLIKFFTAVAASAFEITFTNLGAVDTNYFEARRIWLADYVQAPYEAASGAAPQWKATSKLSRTKGGSLRRNRGASNRELRFETIFNSEADRAIWSDLLYVCDPANEIVIDLFPANAAPRRERDFTVMGSLEALNPMVFENDELHRLQLAIVES